MNLKARITLFALCAATLGTLGACSNDDAPQGGNADGKPIALMPSLSAPTCTEGSGTQTRADRTYRVAFAEGGDIQIKMYATDPADYQQNTFAMNADGKMVRKPYVAGSGDTEGNLNVLDAGTYHFVVSGYADCLMNIGDSSEPFLPIKAYLKTNGSTTERTVAADGTVNIDCALASACFCVQLYNPDGRSPYDGSASVTLGATLTDLNGASITTPVSTIHGGAFWGNLAEQLIAKGTEVVQIAVNGTTYKVISPAAISLRAGRLIGFSVRVGATGITVEMKDGSNVVTDFEVEPVTNAEAEIPGSYNGVMGKKLAIAGLESYWIAPVNAVVAGTAAQDISFATICPNGWHVPTVAEFRAMTGYAGSLGGPPESVNKDAVFEAFGGNSVKYLSSEKSESHYYSLFIASDKEYRMSSIGVTDTTGFQLRCVQKAN